MADFIEYIQLGVGSEAVPIRDPNAFPMTGGTITGDVTMSGDVTMGGSTMITGDVTIDGATTITGDATMDGSTTITGDVTMSGNVTVTSESGDRTLLFRRNDLNCGGAVTLGNNSLRLITQNIGDDESNQRTMLLSNSADKPNLAKCLVLSDIIDGSAQYYTIYGDHNKPTPDGIGIGDYVIEEGTSGIWSYRKWKSGKKECWGVYSATVSHSAQWNGGYEYMTGNINLPFTFDSSPVVTFHGKVTTGNTIPGYVEPTNSTVKLMLWASASGSQLCYFYIHVIGK